MLLETAMLSISNDYVRSLRVIGKWKSFVKSKKARQTQDQKPKHIPEEIIAESNNDSILDKLFIDILELSKASSDEVIKIAIPERAIMFISVCWAEIAHEIRIEVSKLILHCELLQVALKAVDNGEEAIGELFPS